MSTHYSRYGEKLVGKERIADVFWSHNFINGVVHKLSKRVWSDLMKVFFPAKISKEMNLAPRSLNLQGIKILQSVESNHKKYFVSVITLCQEK